MASYDPDELPEVDEAELTEALSLGLIPIFVVCDEPGSKIDDHTSVQFIAFVNTLPRTGDRIQIEDGTICIVERLYFRTVRTGVTGFVSMITIVFAVRFVADDE